MIFQVHKSKATLEIYRSDLPSFITAEDIDLAMAALSKRKKPILVSELMLITGKCKTSVKNRLREAGVEPVGFGGKTGKENLYSRNDALQAMEVI